MSSNVRQLTDHGVPVYPITDRSLVIGLHEGAFATYVMAWDGASTPVPANIPAGVVVNYNGTDYPGTLAASASTAQDLYLVASATQQDEYDRYITTHTGSTYAWNPLASTAIVSPVIADDLVTNDASKALSAKQGKVLGDKTSELEAKVDGLHKVIEVTTTTAWYEVAIDNIPSGTKIVKVETSVSAEVYLRTDASGTQGQQRITDGTTTNIDANYILSSVPCNITVTYGYIDEADANLNEELGELGGKIDSLHKIQNATTTTAWFEVSIDTIPSGTKIVKVETSVSAEVYLRDVPGGSQGQQRITSGTVTEFDAPYLLTSVPCNVTLVYGYIDVKLEEVDAELEELTASTKGLYNNQSVTTTGAWAEVAIDTIPSGTTIAEVITSVPASVSLRLDASGAQGAQDITNGSVTTFDAHYLVTSVPCTVTLKTGIVAGLQYTVNTKLSKIQNAIISEWCIDNPDGNIAIRDICIYDESALPTDVYHISTLTNNGTYAQLTILKNYEIVSNFWSTEVGSLPLITEIPPYNNSGISAKAIIDWSNIPANGMGRINNKKVNNKFSIIPYLQNAVSPDSRWSGKKMLAIGDSVTVGGQWANEVGRILGMSVSIHAKAGVGVITMVDGDSTLPALSSADVADKDLICIMGLYNERSYSVTNPGEIGDMYPTQNSSIGRLNYAVDKIYQKLDEAGNHNCIVVIISGHKYGRNQWANRSAYDTVTVGGVQMQDGDALLAVTKKAADYNSIPLIDLMNGGNINKYNWNYFQNSSTPYNTAYIPADGENDGTNKPFASLSVAPDASQNNGKYITVVGVQNCYRSNGTEWVADATPYVWYGDQLHPNNAGYLRLASHIAQQLLTI